MRRVATFNMDEKNGFPLLDFEADNDMKVKSGSENNNVEWEQVATLQERGMSGSVSRELSGKMVSCFFNF